MKFNLLYRERTAWDSAWRHLDERVGGFAKGTCLVATARTNEHRVVYPLKTFVACTVGVRTQQSRSNVHCVLNVNCSPYQKTRVLQFLPDTQNCVPNCAG